MADAATALSLERPIGDFAVFWPKQNLSNTEYTV